MYFIVKNQCEQAAAKLLEVCFFKHDRWVGRRGKNISSFALDDMGKKGVTSDYLYISVFFLTVHHKSDREGFGFEKQPCLFYGGVIMRNDHAIVVLKTPKAPTKTWGESISAPPKKTGCFFAAKGAAFGVCQNLPDFEVDENKIGILRTFFFVKVNRLGFLLEKSGKTNSAGDKAYRAQVEADFLLKNRTPATFHCSNVRRRDSAFRQVMFHEMEVLSAKACCMMDVKLMPSLLFLQIRCL